MIHYFQYLYHVRSTSARGPICEVNRLLAQVILGMPYDEKVDVWASGCIFAELIKGEVSVGKWVYIRRAHQGRGQLLLQFQP